jgi:hypothetical protein
MTLTCVCCGCVIEREMRVIMVDPYKERVKHMIQSECNEVSRKRIRGE